ncbi:iron-sulfur cluster biosynthesis family protein [Desemzia sp. RIT804]|uniref:iron-sulfur cluster biosynthesis family protein n=1 Tax=Desemzia sp. RIT 804 TaxID=2810209 RepID=UPI0019512AC6|nr:iron-sulfur cluster biosynthesis family protein [Desemzia sp. RIT 804]MBM6614645.1 iron-sulfur cluster biosynthesis family protein [Desemzia sp. RIT 804]
MFLEITEAAQQRIQKAQSISQGSLALFYESKVGCECGNTGIFTLQLRQSPDNDMDGTLESNLGILPIQKWSLSYLDQEMKLDYKKDQNSLILKGESGVINSNVIITNEDGGQIL